MSELEGTDKAVLATVVTALLIREGGRVLLTPKEWQVALDHSGSLFMHRDDEDRDVLVVLMPRPEYSQ